VQLIRALTHFVRARSALASLAALADPATLPEITRIEAIEASDEFEPTEL